MGVQNSSSSPLTDQAQSLWTTQSDLPQHWLGSQYQFCLLVAFLTVTNIWRGDFKEGWIIFTVQEYRPSRMGSYGGSRIRQFYTLYLKSARMERNKCCLSSCFFLFNASNWHTSILHNNGFHWTFRTRIMYFDIITLHYQLLLSALSFIPVPS